MKQLLFIALVIVTLASGCSNPSSQFQVPSSDEMMVSSSYDVAVEEELKEVNFSKTGNIVSWDETTEEFTDNWRLIYDEPGMAAMTVELVFDDESRCPVGSEEFLCKDVLNKDFNGERVHMQGIRDGDVVYVKLITF
ncbi:hypothetical protein GF391_00375 [Candidatus Uhrbacteria bacterium]|nr:hypothetical protein [Candidatus Uhrbacteria bacterium]